MGSCIMINCGQCGYEKSFILGIGFAYSPYSVFYDRPDEPGIEERKPLLASLVKSSKTRKEALDLIAAGGLPGEYGHEVYGCPHCRHLCERFYFRIETKEKFFEPEYKCSKCKRTLLRLNFNSYGRRLQWPCPSCGKKKLSICENIITLWD